MRQTAYKCEAVYIPKRAYTIAYIYKKKRVAHARPSFYVASIYIYRLFSGNGAISSNSGSVNRSLFNNFGLSSSFQAVGIGSGSFFAFTAGEHRYAECNSEKEN